MVFISLDLGLTFVQKPAIYEGEWENGIYDGKGTFLWPNGSKYIGTWKDGFENGFGTFEGYDKVRSFLPSLPTHHSLYRQNTKEIGNPASITAVENCMTP